MGLYWNFSLWLVWNQCGFHGTVLEFFTLAALSCLLDVIIIPWIAFYRSSSSCSNHCILDCCGHSIEMHHHPRTTGHMVCVHPHLTVLYGHLIVQPLWWRFPSFLSGCLTWHTSWLGWLALCASQLDPASLPLGSLPIRGPQPQLSLLLWAMLVQLAVSSWVWDIIWFTP